jgi:hypothetical protein
MSDGTLVFSGEAQIFAYSLITFRSALGLELRSKNGMVASRFMNAKTIIPQISHLGITDVTGRLSRKKKIKAYDDLNAFMVANGLEDRPLDDETRNR